MILLHGNPFGVNIYIDIVPLLLSKMGLSGYRLLQYMKGVRNTPFLHKSSPSSSEQAALGHGLVALMDALHIRRLFSPDLTGGQLL